MFSSARERQARRDLQVTPYRRRNNLEDFGAQMGMTPAVTTLVAANLVVFALQFLTSRTFDLVGWGAFIPYNGFAKFELWRFVSYMFLHDPRSMFHIFFNMFALWMFGPRIEEIWGRRIFLIYYFVCGIGGALLYGAFSILGMDARTEMIGASGAVYGLLLAFGVTYPNQIILLFFIIPLRAKYAVLVFGGIELMSAMASASRGGGQIAHLAHLGGMAFGWLFLLWATGGRLGRIPRVPPWGHGRRAAGEYGRSPRRDASLSGWWRAWRTRLRIKVVDGKRQTRGGNGEVSLADRERVDRILEKISREGLKSLTDEEQDVLRRASKKP
jgi:membrane associated rhomboid family serine protease